MGAVIYQGSEFMDFRLADPDNREPIEYGPRRPWDHSIKRFGATEKAKGELGFEAKVELRGGLERTVEWTRANLELIDRCIARHAEEMARAGSPVDELVSSPLSTTGP